MKQDQKKDIGSIQAKGKKFVGQVVSTKMNKTVIVAVTHSRRHPLYKKVMRKTKRFAVHVEQLVVDKGDRVSIRETKPMSKRKHFVVVEKL